MLPTIIPLSGIDGAGKDTVLEYFIEFANEHNLTYAMVQEPGGCEVGREIRKLLKSPVFEIDRDTETLLFAASRASNLANLPTDVDIIFYNRWYLCSLGYQVYGREPDRYKAYQYFKSTWLPLVQMSGVLDLEQHQVVTVALVEESLRRALGREEKCRLEQFDIDFYKRSQEAMLNTDMSKYSKDPKTITKYVIENYGTLDNLKANARKVFLEIMDNSGLTHA